jgi:hypothetical protein
MTKLGFFESYLVGMMKLEIAATDNFVNQGIISFIQKLLIFCL